MSISEESPSGRGVPAVSVILPTYNRSRLLERAVRSVLAQSYGGLELIVVDDASTDDTAAVLATITDSRLRLLSHRENQGASAARNAGIKAARGEFVAFQDSDDVWMPDKLQKQMAVFRDSDIGMGVVYHGLFRLDGTEARYSPPAGIARKEGDLALQILPKSFVTTTTLLVRRRLLVEVGLFDENLPRFQDWELVMRLARACRFRFLDEPLTIAFVTEESITHDQAAALEARRAILEKHEEHLAASPAAMAEHLYVVGHMTCLYNSPAEGRRYLRRAIGAHPGHPKAWIALVLTLFGGAVYGFADNLRKWVGRWA